MIDLNPMKASVLSLRYRLQDTTYCLQEIHYSFSFVVR